MKATDLIRLNVEIENQINTDGDLIPLSGEDSTIFTISRLAADYVLFFRHDVPLEIREPIKVMGPEKALNYHETVRRLLARFTPCGDVFTGKGYYFARAPVADEFPDVALREGRFVVTVNGKPVSWAWTQDGNQRASELAVETLPEFRRRGCGRRVAAAWASNEIKAGRVPFYSYEIGNLASAALARSLAVVHYATSTSYSS